MKRISIGSRLGIATAALVGILAVTQPVPAQARGGGGHGGGGHGGGFHGGGFHGGGFHGGGFHRGGFHGGGYGGWASAGSCYYPYVYPYCTVW
jgi:hypothetical protein